jgi:hypothetical protein
VRRHANSVSFFSGRKASQAAKAKGKKDERREFIYLIQSQLHSTGTLPEIKKS